MVSKIQGWQISSRNRVNHLYKSVPFTEKTNREGLKLVSKIALKKWDPHFRYFGIFRPEKQDYPFGCSLQEIFR